MTSRAALTICLVAVAGLIGGCGVGPGEERDGGAELRITQDFGTRLLGEDSVEKVREDQTVMRLLRADNDVKTRYGGRFVQAIDGLEGGGKGGFADWFYYVNGLEGDVGAAEYELAPGDVVQWDHRNWRGSTDIRAIVGAFPEPFVNGMGGKRFPTRMECDDAGSSACKTVKRTLSEQGVTASGASFGASGTQNVIRVVVAPWRRARELPSARVIELGPKRSGVFARFTEEGRSLDLLDERGRVVRRAAAGSGLVAAMRPSDDEVLWLVTGSDEAGMERAAKALNRNALRDAFAVVAAPDGVEKLPLKGDG